MKKIRILSYIILIIMIFCVNDVYAGGPSPIYPVNENEILEVYEGDSLTVDWQTYMEGITDFELSIPEMVENNEMPTQFYNSMSTDLEGALVSADKNKVYYIQSVVQEQKENLAVETKIATTTITIPQNNIKWKDEENTLEYRLAPNLNIVWASGNKSEDASYYQPVVKILKYKKGDVNRDYNTDFFDITTAIGLVYDQKEDYVWNKRVYQAAKIFDTYSEDELAIMPVVEEVDFFDIIDLIGYVYNEYTIIYNLNGGSVDAEENLINKYTNLDDKIYVPAVTKTGYYLDYIKVTYKDNGQTVTEFKNHIDYLDSSKQGYELTFVWTDKQDTYIYNMTDGTDLKLRIKADGTLYYTDGTQLVDENGNNVVARSAYLYRNGENLNIAVFSKVGGSFGTAQYGGNIRYTNEGGNEEVYINKFGDAVLSFIDIDDNTRAIQPLVDWYDMETATAKRVDYTEQGESVEHIGTLVYNKNGQVFVYSNEKGQYVKLENINKKVEAIILLSDSTEEETSYRLYTNDNYVYEVNETEQGIKYSVSDPIKLSNLYFMKDENGYFCGETYEQSGTSRFYFDEFVDRTGTFVALG